MMPGFPYVKKCILRKIGTVVQKIQNLLTKLPVHHKKKLVLGV
jgi:hypothetical protein